MVEKKRKYPSETGELKTEGIKRIRRKRNKFSKRGKRLKSIKIHCYHREREITAVKKRSSPFRTNDRRREEYFYNLSKKKQTALKANRRNSAQSKLDI